MIEALQALLLRAPLDPGDQARAQKLLRRLGRSDPAAAARFAAELRLPVWTEALGVRALRPCGPGRVLPGFGLGPAPLGPALDAWWAARPDRHPLISALWLSLGLAPAEPARQIRALIQAVARGADDVWPGCRKVLDRWPGCAAPLALPLEAVGPAAPEPALAAARLAAADQRNVDADAFFRLWAALPGGRWVDLGSGDGANVRGLSRPDRRLLGVDVGPAAELRIPVSQRPEILREATLQAVGAPADVVLLAYPTHHELVAADGRRARSVVFQLETAWELLRPGGAALLLSESPGLIRAALGAAGAFRAADLAAEPLGEASLRAHGLEPYTPSVRELENRGTDARRVRPFAWAFGLILWKG